MRFYDLGDEYQVMESPRQDTPNISYVVSRKKDGVVVGCFLTPPTYNCVRYAEGRRRGHAHTEIIDLRHHKLSPPKKKFHGKDHYYHQTKPNSASKGGVARGRSAATTRALRNVKGA